MNPTRSENGATWQGIVGYLNFSNGTPDVRFQRQWNEFYLLCRATDDKRPWREVRARLEELVAQAQASGGPFADVSQAASVVSLCFDHVVPAYRAFHSDLLGHLEETWFYHPFFLVRVIEAILQQGPPWQETERIVRGALRLLNDYAGYRPVALLETRPTTEPYEHEKFRPVPMYLRGAGVACGPYCDIIQKALDILGNADGATLAQAHFVLERLEEWALDVRGYDHSHPVSRRPNHIFGEWDTRVIDDYGGYRRFVSRRLLLEVLQRRVRECGLPADEALFEAGAVLAGSVLMATSLTGQGLTDQDSSTHLGQLLPQVARLRDLFYARLLEQVPGALGDRLRQEAVRLGQPFGACRMYLNQYLARDRALQLQRRQAALIMATLGNDTAAIGVARQIGVPSVRFSTEIRARLAAVRTGLRRGRLDGVTDHLDAVEELLRRGIACGAILDPWNILGFQGLFPLSAAREDAIRDLRADELVALMDQLFAMCAEALVESAAHGQEELRRDILVRFRRLAQWWDQFATTTVGDLRKVHGGSALQNAEHVARFMAHWHGEPEATASRDFWRRHLSALPGPGAIARVASALLDRNDQRAALALLMQWLSQAQEIPLEEEHASFYRLAARWLGQVPEDDLAHSLCRFFDHFEANAADLLSWPPHLDTEGEGSGQAWLEELAATLQTGSEGSLLDEDNSAWATPLGRHLQDRLRFFAALGRLWQHAIERLLTLSGKRPALSQAEMQALQSLLHNWQPILRQVRDGLAELAEQIYAIPLSSADSGEDAHMDYDRRRQFRDDVIQHCVHAWLEVEIALRSMAAAQKVPAADSAQGADVPRQPATLEELTVSLERALWAGQLADARMVLPAFLEQIRLEPIVYMPFNAGGKPQGMARALLTERILRRIGQRLPACGLFAEVQELLQCAFQMEHATEGERITTFDRLFEELFSLVVENVLDQICRGPSDDGIVAALEQAIYPFVRLWVEHSKSLRLSALDQIQDRPEWVRLMQFLRSYGGDLFHPRFMTPANLRGILHRGVEHFLEELMQRGEVALGRDLGSRVAFDEAARHLRITLEALIENFPLYVDYNATTIQSDYGENVGLFLEFAALGVRYQRQAWQLRPLWRVHEILVRKGLHAVARAWQKSVAELTVKAAQALLDDLERLEQVRGIHLKTLRDLLDERFVSRMDLHYLLAQVAPVAHELVEKGPGPLWHQFENDLRRWMDRPIGIGLDPPQWVVELWTEVHKTVAQEKEWDLPWDRDAPIPD